MLAFKQIRLVNGFYRYEIYMEGDFNNVGVFDFNPETGQINEKVDPVTPFDWLGHFLQAVKDEKGEYRLAGVSAWY